MKYLMYPFIFIIMLPIEFPCWKAYRKRQPVPNYFIWIWIRNFGTIEQNSKLTRDPSIPG